MLLDAMDRLPAELLRHVFLLVEPGKRGRLALVCRRWKHVLDFASLWKDATAYLGKYSKQQYRSIDARQVSKAKLVQGFDWNILPPRMCDMNVGGPLRHLRQTPDPGPSSAVQPDALGLDGLLRRHRCRHGVRHEYYAQLAVSRRDAMRASQQFEHDHV